MNIKKIEITKLKPAQYNPRKDLKPADKEYQKIKRSIEEFGYIDPIIVNKDLTIIGGHQRLKVLKDLGYDEVECVIVDVEKTKEKALNIALNKISGEWDEEILKDLLRELTNSEIDAELSGFDFVEIEKILEETNAKDQQNKEIEEMELKSFEHYDYIVFVFRNTYDWINALQVFDIKKVNGGFSPKCKKIGLGRVVDGGKLLQAIGLDSSDIEQGGAVKL